MQSRTAPKRLALAGLAIAALSSSSAAAHDFFLLPSTFEATPGQVVAVDATVSAAFPRVETAVTRDRLAAAEVIAPAGRQPLSGGQSGKYQLPANRAGLAVGIASVAAREVEYPPERIGLILEEYDIEGPAAAAVAALPKSAALKVTSRRFAKTLVCVGRCEDTSAAATAVGHKLEFIAVGGDLRRYRLLSAGRPVPQHPVAIATAGSRARLTTDGAGEVSLPQDIKGPVMLFAAQMTPPPAGGDRFGLDLASLTLSPNGPKPTRGN